MDLEPLSAPGAGAILRTLTDHGVDFVLIGGIAGIAYGSAYPTFDVDVAYRRDRANLDRLAGALRELNARLRVGRTDDDDAQGVAFQLDAETLERGSNFTFTTDAGAFDVLGDPGGIRGYDELASSAEELEIEGVRVKVASIDHLIAMKSHAGRTKDRLALDEYLVLADERRRRGLDQPRRRE